MSTAPAPRLSDDLDSRLVRAFFVCLLVLVVLPATAGAALVRVEPYREPPDPSGAPGCAKYMNCPVDMVVFIAAPGETNHVKISSEALPPTGAPARSRFLVSDEISPVQAGAGCQPVGRYAVACEAATIGPVELGDRQDRITGFAGPASGGAGDDVLDVNGSANGGEGDDIVIARNGEGGPGEDVLSVISGDGGAGSDLLRCFPDFASCDLKGGAGDDRLIGGTENRQVDQLSGGAGRDFLDGRGGKDTLVGGPGSDRLTGGAGRDGILGGSGNDRIFARDGQRDRVDCGSGRDTVTADRVDIVSRNCERVRRSPGAR